MQYRIVCSVDGQIKSETTTNIFAFMETQGCKCVGRENHPSRRQELQGQPKFESFAGPMWDGDAICYEDMQTYKRLSA